MNVSQMYVGYGQSVVISWNSSNAYSGFINNYIGNVSVSGSHTVYPTQTTTYTGTFYGQNGQTVTCSATVTVANTYVPPPVYQNPTPYVTLSAVPYTGLELGPVGTALYWAFLVLWCLFAAYLIAVKRVHMSIYRWYKKALFGEEVYTIPAATALSTHSNTLYRTPIAHTSNVSDAIDSFVLSQINRGRN